MKQERIKTTVVIDGQTYKLAGFESEEHLHRVAITVDKQMTAVRASNENLSTDMVAVLAALNIANDLIKLKEQQAAQPAPRPAEQPPAEPKEAHDEEAEEEYAAPEEAPHRPEEENAEPQEAPGQTAQPILPPRGNAVRPVHRSRNSRTEEDFY